MMGVLRNETSCIPFSSKIVEWTLILDKQVVPWGATNVSEKVAFIAG